MVFATGTTLGGLLVAVPLAVLGGLASPLPEQVRLVTAGVLVVGLALLDLGSPRLRLPQRSRLIPQDVFGRGLARGLLRFGVEYGTGVRTLIPGAATYQCALWVVLVNPPWWLTAVAGALFGFSRSLAILQFVLLGRDGWAAFLSTHARLLERGGSLLAGVLLVAALLVT